MCLKTIAENTGSQKNHGMKTPFFVENINMPRSKVKVLEVIVHS